MSGRVRRRGRGWQVDIYMADGSRVQRQEKSWPEADKALRRLRVQKARGEDRAVLLERVFSDYIVSLRGRAKPSTIRHVQYQADALLEHFGRAVLVSEIEAKDLDHYIRVRREEGRSPATINSALRVLRVALRRAGVGMEVRMLKETKRLPSTLSDAQIEDLLYLASPPFDLIILLAARAGLRKQEILHLRRGDFMFDDGSDTGVIKVQAKRKEECGVDWTPKDDEERAIPFKERLGKRLKEHLAKLDEGDWLFPGTEGGPRKDVTKPIRDIWKTAGLYDKATKPGLHQLRRTWATEMLGRGADIETVRQLGGWSDLETVQRYVGSTEERKRQAIARLD